jgi:pilus assembly protein CpaB
MAAILPSGMRAISTEISLESGASGFILPNDHVDVILSRHVKGPGAAGVDTVVSDTILSNIRVLAIDQTIEEKNGQKVVVGKTATLELKPEQTELLTKSRQTGTLALALRSIADANAPPTPVEHKHSNTVSVIRFGVQSSSTVQQ